MDDDDRIKRLRELIDEIVNLQDITQKLLDNITDQVANRLTVNIVISRVVLNIVERLINLPIDQPHERRPFGAACGALIITVRDQNQEAPGTRPGSLRLFKFLIDLPL